MPNAATHGNLSASVNPSLVTMTQMREIALATARKGFKIFPIAGGCKKPPLIVGWQVCATDDETLINEWWATWPNANVGIHCDGLIVLDVDKGKGGYDSLSKLDIEHGVPATYEVGTPSGGVHLYYASDISIPNGVNVFGPGIDVRSTGGYVLAPGSSVQGRPYVLKNSGLVAAPAWLTERRVEPPKPAPPPVDTAAVNQDNALARAREWLALQEPVKEGERNHRGYAAAAMCRDYGLTENGTLALMADAWKCDPPLDEAELRHVVHSAYTYAQKPAATLSVEAMF